MESRREENILKEFGQRVKAARKAKKLSLRKLALNIDMDWSFLNRLEKGTTNPSLTTILALAEGLGIAPVTLLPEKY